MYRNSHNQTRSQNGRFVKCNSAIVGVLTILCTGLTAYLITVIAFPQNPKFATNISFSKLQDSTEIPASRLRRTLNSNSKVNTPRLAKTNTNDSISRNHTIIFPIEWQPIVDASESIMTRVMPNEQHFPETLRRIKEKLSVLRRSELLKLAKILQDRIDLTRPHPKKRQVESMEVSASTNLAKKSSGDNVVVRSKKMNQLMNYLERIESSLPQIDVNKLERLSALDDERSIVRIMKPEVMGAVLHSENTPGRVGHEMTKVDNGPVSWREPIEYVAPADPGWSQQQEVVEEWPSTTIQPSVRPRKKKRKKIIVTTTTTTSTTPFPVIETSTYIPPSSPSPPAAFEEVWIEEEEDIIRPPRRKLKKYKKKTAPETTTSTTTSTTTTTTTSTTTTTTPAPIISTVQPIEDWPEEVWPQTNTKEVWPQTNTKEVWPQTNTKEVWPQTNTKKPTTNQWPTGQQEEEKWPEEEWLNKLRDDIQNVIHIMYENPR